MLGRPKGLLDVKAPTFFLNNRLTDGGEVVSLTHRPPFTPRKIPGTHFCYRLSRPQGHSVAGRIRSTENSNDFIRNRICNLPVFSTVPEPITLLHAPLKWLTWLNFMLQEIDEESFLKCACPWTKLHLTLMAMLIAITATSGTHGWHPKSEWSGLLYDVTEHAFSTDEAIMEDIYLSKSESFFPPLNGW
jgi:hypothetical protein